MNEASSEKQQKLIGPEKNIGKRTESLARSSYFRYYIHDAVASFRLQLLGELTEADIADLNGCWRTAKTTLGSRQLILDLHALKSVDETGKQWLAGIAQEGATCSPEGYLRDIVAGKHTAGIDAAASVAKPGLVGRIMNLFRGVGVEAAK